MRLLRSTLLLAPALLTSGCGYIHFGRIPPERTSDTALQQAYADVALEKKILQQELALSRKETDTLRTALEHASGSTESASPEISRTLARTTRQLEELRTSYARLEAERKSPASVKEPTATGTVMVLQQEKARLQQELASTRSENATLAEKLKASLAANEQAQVELSQLNADLVAQKQARERAEKVTIALRAQLEAVMARAGRADATPSATPAPASSAALAPTIGDSASAPLSALQAAKAPPSDAVPSVELRTSAQRIQAVAEARAKSEAKAAPVIALESRASAPGTPSTAGQTKASAAAATRTYTVQAGDTLERISVKFYGAADQWSKIYAANAETLAQSQGLKPGVVLQIPEK